jgi:hypothetical protein
MSLPTPPNNSVKMDGGAIVNPLDVIIGSINSSPYFIGLMMLCLNLGGRFIALEVTKAQEQFLQNPWVRRSLIFAMIFMGTRNVLVAFWMTLVIVLFIGYLFNENSSLCIYKAGAPGSTCNTKETEGLAIRPAEVNASSPPPGLTPEEQDIFKKLQEKMLRSQPQDVPPPPALKSDVSDQKKEEEFTQTYLENIQLLKGGEGFRVGRF